MKKNDFVSFRDIDLEDGFWKERYDLNRAVTIRAVRDRFEDSGRFDALRFNRAEKEMPLHYYYDSDAAKWMEAVAYLAEHGTEDLGEYFELIEELIGRMENAQREDGYLNSYHQQVTPEDIFQKRNHHELYCAGHLMEAAAAYHHATGDERFLRIVDRYFGCIEKAFFTEKTAAFSNPGHEEIELALFTMWRETGDEKYRRMAEGFLKRRGVTDESENYDQNATDIYHLFRAEGHAVRDLYFLCGVADMALATGDERLYASLDRVFDDMIHRQMYITGGVGATAHGEKFTEPYDLPNDTAYCESCASIALIFWMQRMRRLKKDAEYGHVAERVLYNGLLSSTSLDGRKFFYVNPLEIDLTARAALREEDRKRMPITQRVEVFSCSCCPPNINRIFAKIADYLCFEEENGLCVEQYMNATVHSAYGDLRIAGNYAADGRVTLSADGYTGSVLSVRIPEWHGAVKATLNGKEISVPATDGYAVFAVGNSFTLDLDFGIGVRFVTADPRVRADAGRVAFTYGPAVYCLEALDNGENLNALSVDPATACAKRDGVFGGLPVFTCAGFRDETPGSLYAPVSEQKRKAVSLRFIPYFTFANRGESDLLTWVRGAEMPRRAKPGE